MLEDESESRSIGASDHLQGGFELGADTYMGMGQTSSARGPQVFESMFPLAHGASHFGVPLCLTTTAISIIKGDGAATIPFSEAEGDIGFVANEAEDLRELLGLQGGEVAKSPSPPPRPKGTEGKHRETKGSTSTAGRLHVLGTRGKILLLVVFDIWVWVKINSPENPRS